MTTMMSSSSPFITHSTDSTHQRESLGDFLRTRRARLSPAEVGLPQGSRRRTLGLRREEVASLASVGISWYTALEQGRDIRPSEAILSSLADVLRLTPDERQHLFWLAGYSLVIKPVREQEENISPALHQMLGALEPNPAYIIGLCWNYLAWNEAADRIFSITSAQGPYAYNLLWQLFMSPEKRQLYVNWDKVAQNVVAEYRTETEKYPCDGFSQRFIQDLRAASEDFDRLWMQYDVQRTIIRRKEINHAQLGRLSFDHTPLQLMEHPTLKMIVYTPTPESAHRLSLMPRPGGTDPRSGS